MSKHDVSGTPQNPVFNFDQLSEAERKELEAWLDILEEDEELDTYDPGKDYTFVPPRDVAYWVNLHEKLIGVAVKANEEEELRLQQQAQQAADDKEYFDTASAYEDRF